MRPSFSTPSIVLILIQCTRAIQTELYRRRCSRGNRVCPNHNDSQRPLCEQPAHTSGVRTRDGSLRVLVPSRMRIPQKTKNAGMMMVNAHIFLSRSKVSSRFVSRATVCALNRDLERSMPRSSLDPTSAETLVCFCGNHKHAPERKHPR